MINHGKLFINVTRVTFHDKVCAALVFLRHSDFELQSLPPMQCKKNVLYLDDESFFIGITV